MHLGEFGLGRQVVVGRGELRREWDGIIRICATCLLSCLVRSGGTKTAPLRVGSIDLEYRSALPLLAFAPNNASLRPN